MGTWSSTCTACPATSSLVLGRLTVRQSLAAIHQHTMQKPVLLQLMWLPAVLHHQHTGIHLNGTGMHFLVSYLNNQCLKNIFQVGSYILSPFAPADHIAPLHNQKCIRVEQNRCHGASLSPAINSSQKSPQVVSPPTRTCACIPSWKDWMMLMMQSAMPSFSRAHHMAVQGTESWS